MVARCSVKAQVLVRIQVALLTVSLIKTLSREEGDIDFLELSSRLWEKKTL